jgi:hypothetical protein
VPNSTRPLLMMSSTAASPATPRSARRANTTWCSTRASDCKTATRAKCSRPKRQRAVAAARANCATALPTPTPSMQSSPSRPPNDSRVRRRSATSTVRSAAHRRDATAGDRTRASARSARAHGIAMRSTRGLDTMSRPSPAETPPRCNSVASDSLVQRPPTERTKLYGIGDSRPERTAGAAGMALALACLQRLGRDGDEEGASDWEVVEGRQGLEDGGGTAATEWEPASNLHLRRPQELLENYVP